jgi:hypothetical protein
MVAMHLLIPFAGCPLQAGREALAGLKLPQLTQLLGRMAPAAADEGEASNWSPPHERALARALGLPVTDGAIPWAAWQATRRLQAAPSTAWACISPASWQVASDHISMSDPRALQLDLAQAQTLLAAMQPFFDEDGIHLHLDSATQWLAEGEIFRGLASASLDRVAGQDISAWMPRGPQAAALRRLQNEMQMLLYTHPLNDQRLAQGLPPINSFWVSGSGALPPNWQPPSQTEPVVPRRLAQPALQGDWPAWRQAWQATDAQECQQLLEQLEQGLPATLTLCGLRHARSWQPAHQGWLTRLARSLRPVDPLAVLNTL